MSEIADLLPKDAPEVHFQLVATWLSLNTERAPGHADFDVGKWTSNQHECFLVHQLSTDGGPLKLQFGEATELSFIPKGADVSGKCLSDVLDRFLLEKAENAFRNCLRRNEPYYSEHISSQFGRGQAHFKRLSLPLANENGTLRSAFGSVVRIQS
ncbi:MAG: hypothetical protein AAGF53_19205 [Pseudomonadota bacterium]